MQLLQNHNTYDHELMAARGAMGLAWLLCFGVLLAVLSQRMPASSISVPVVVSGHPIAEWWEPPSPESRDSSGKPTREYWRCENLAREGELPAPGRLLLGGRDVVAVPYFLCRTAALRPTQRVAVLTQLSVDRLPVLRALVGAFGGPVSAAVLVRGPGDVAQLYEAYKQWQELREHVTFHLLLDPHVLDKYPVNLLRNLALAHEPLEFVLMLDVDFVGGTQLQADLNSAVAALWDDFADAAPKPRLLAVVAAFEVIDQQRQHAPPTPSQIDQRLWGPLDRPSLVHMYEQLQAFQVHYFKGVHAHLPTDYARWISSSADRPYEISYDYLYEPYYVLRRQECPPYDEAFIGYGNDKASHAYELAAAGFRFFVAPRAFVVHQDHGEPQWRADQSSSSSWEMWFEFVRRVSDKHPSFIQTIPAWLYHGCLSGDCPPFWEWQEI